MAAFRQHAGETFPAVLIRSGLMTPVSTSVSARTGSHSGGESGPPLTATPYGSVCATAVGRDQNPWRVAPRACASLRRGSQTLEVKATPLSWPKRRSGRDRGTS